jgi:OPA family sugar phosphate sensor protein UhpC-like MFS transporter
MAVTYFGVSMVRTCLQDWTSLYLSEAKGLPLPTTARCLFLWELGGFGGTFIAGAVSDRVFCGRRGPVVTVCCALLAPSLLVLLHTTSPLVCQLTYLWLGVCAFPVHVLIGLFSREVVPPSVSSTAGGFVKMIAQIGGAMAGYPLGVLQQWLGWEGVYAFLALVACIAAAAGLPLWGTTAQIRIQGRNGTVQDFGAMQRKSSSNALNRSLGKSSGDLSKHM